MRDNTIGHNKLRIRLDANKTETGQGKLTMRARPRVVRHQPIKSRLFLLRATAWYESHAHVEAVTDLPLLCYMQTTQGSALSKVVGCVHNKNRVVLHDLASEQNACIFIYTE
jgi:hypothetical protein